MAGTEWQETRARVINVKCALDGDDMHGQTILIGFPGISVAESNQHANSLADFLSDTTRGITITRTKERPDAQDFGGTLAIILGTASVTALAKGISAWLARNSGARVEIRKEGKVVLAASNLDSKDVTRIAEALSEQK